MEKRQLIASVITFFAAFLVMVATVFAWFTLTNVTRTDNVTVPVGEYDAVLLLEVSKNDGDYVVIDTPANMAALFSNAVPSDRFDFRLTITSLTDTPALMRVELAALQNLSDDPLIDMRNVIVLEEGEVRLDGSASFRLPNDMTPLTVLGQTFDDFRLNNLTSGNGAVTLIDPVLIPALATRVLEFSLIYDAQTSEKGYQEAMLVISAIRVFFS
ncbi:MAG: hypothetical protein EA374_08030 [Acholeplasmatales bacterium]|nr:MAG: hypothetical protein EA374_08030 [Acholeplasmatales bacterium]